MMLSLKFKNSIIFLIFTFLPYQSSFSEEDNGEISINQKSNYNEPDLKEFVSKIKLFLNTEKKEQLADLISFPIKVNKKNKNVIVKNKSEFIQNYSFIINKILIKSIEKQSLDNIFENSFGYMIGNGSIWFIKTCHLKPFSNTCTDDWKFKIVTINN